MSSLSTVAALVVGSSSSFSSMVPRVDQIAEYTIQQHYNADNGELKPRLFTDDTNYKNTQYGWLCGLVNIHTILYHSKELFSEFHITVF